MRFAARRLAPLALLAAAAWTGVALIESFGSDRIGREMAASAKSGDIMPPARVIQPTALRSVAQRCST